MIQDFVSCWGTVKGNHVVKEYNIINQTFCFVSQLVKDDFQKREVKKIELPPPLTLPPITPISRYIKVLPSPKPYPQTSSSQVGWRSAHNLHKLEIYGSYARPKGGLVKQLNWPAEGIE